MDRTRIHEEIGNAHTDPRVRLIVLDAAIMLEAGWNDVCDRLVYIDAPRDVRLERVAEQRGWTAKEVEARERAQLPLTERPREPIMCSTTPPLCEHLNRQVDDLLRALGIATAVPPDDLSHLRLGRYVTAEPQRGEAA